MTARRPRLLWGISFVYILLAAPPPGAAQEAGRGQDPVATPESVSTIEDTPVTVDVLANDYDPDGDVLSVNSATAGAPSAGVRVIDEATRAGIAQTTETWSANVADFNRDGWQDFLLVRHNMTPAATLYRNDRGTFHEVAGPAFHRASHSCPWGDVNADGLPDIYCTLGGNVGSGVKANQLWIRQPGGGWVDRAAEYGVTDPYGRGQYATFIDVNHDPYPDLYVSNEYPRTDSFLSVNRLFINEGGTSFRSAPEHGLDKEVGGSCVQAADFDQDGWDDLLVCGSESLKLYRNDSGTRFIDVTASAGLGGWASGAVLTDLNGDNLLDLARVDLSSFDVRLQSAGRFGSPVAKRRLRAGQAIAAGDANGDGAQDLYVVEGGLDNDPDLLLVNDGKGTGFRRRLIPQATSGIGDAVAAIDHDRNGTVEFIVLNGHIRIWTEGSPKVTLGPIQLIAYPKTNGRVRVNGDGTVTYVPNRDFTGTDTFTYTISDGAGGTATATDTVTVEPVNDGPRAAGEFALARKNTPLPIKVLANDTDPDGGALRVAAIGSPPAHGRANIDADGTITYTPETDYVGPDSFSYAASDEAGARSSATVTLRVIPPGGCTIQGTERWNSLHGTPGTDVICGGPDIDFIRSHAGNDVLYGRDVNDYLYGGRGSDRMVGGPGADVCRDTSGSNSYLGCENR